MCNWKINCGLFARNILSLEIWLQVSNFTRLNPQKRKEAMKKFVDAVNADPSAKKHLSDWGLKLTPDPISLRGRVLAPEMIFFGSNRRESAGAKGDWNRAATNCPMLTPVALKKWAIFFLNRNQDAAKDFCKMIAQQGPKMGMQIAQPKVTIFLYLNLLFVITIS